MLIRCIGSSLGTSGNSISGTTSSLTVRVLAPAKINLHLEVLGARPDGYHAIETVMLAVELFDEITLTAGSDGLTLSCDNPDLAVGPDNLVLKAARLLKERSGCNRGAEIRLAKHIPWAAGLGGGSSDAAATLAGLNELWKLGLATPELAAMGAELGSDVPFFFHAPAALCTGRGELVEPVSVGRAFDLVLVKPRMGLSTAEVYREAGQRNAEGGTKNPAAVLEALREGDVEKLGRSLHNRLQEPAMRLCPPVAEAYRRLQTSGAAGCLMSGSGSCLFALCRDNGEAMQVAHDLQSGWPPGAEFAGTRVFTVQSCR